MMTHVLLDMTPNDYYLAYVASSRHTSKATKTAAQDASVTLKVITIEIKEKCRKFLSMIFTKSNVASS